MFDLNSKNNSLTIATETKTLPGSATTEYSSALPKGFAPDPDKEKQYVTVGVNPSAVSGTNLDIALYGAFEEGGDKALLKDAIVADVTDSGLVFGQIDLNAFPAAEYFIAWTSHADESANTIEVVAMY